MTALLSWLTAHAGLLAVLAVFVCVVSYIITAGVLALWTASEERQQAAQRQRLDAAMRLTDKPPAAAGLKHRRVS